MKLIVDKNPMHDEVEIVVKCKEIDQSLEQLLEYIRVYSFSVVGRKDGRKYNIGLPDIYYFESLENKTFAYTEKDVYEVQYKIYELENKLEGANFVRISKAGMLNINKLESVKALINGRMEARLANNEKIIINRHYVNDLKKKLNMSEDEDDGRF